MQHRRKFHQCCTFCRCRDEQRLGWPLRSMTVANMMYIIGVIITGLKKKKIIFVSGWQWRWLTFVVCILWINIRLSNVFNLTIQGTRWREREIVLPWRHYSVHANMTKSALLPPEMVHWLPWVNYFRMWDNMPVNSPSRCCSSSMNYFWTCVLLCC